MTKYDKIRIQYRTNQRLWKRFKFAQLITKEKDTHKYLDRVVKKGLEVIENEQKQKLL